VTIFSCLTPLTEAPARRLCVPGLRALTAACVLGAPLLLAGCDESAAAKSSALDQALTQIERAQAGYAPFAGDGKPPINFQQHRQEELAKVVPTLEAASRDGSPAQKTTALRLLADLRASTARYQAQLAIQAAAGLTSRAAVTSSQLVALDRADARADSMTVDTAAARGLLESDLKKTQDQHTTVNQGLAQKKQALTAADQEIAAVRAQAKTLLTQAQTQKAAAFDMQGVERFDAMDQATASEREGNRLLYQAQEKQTQRDQVASQAQVLQSQTDALTKQEQAVNQSLADLAKQVEQERKLTDTARADQAKVAAAVAEELTALSKAYNETVINPLDQALKAADEALAKLDEAVAVAAGPSAQNLQLDQLNKHLNKLAILTDYISVMADYARSLSILTTRANALLPAEHAKQIIEYRAKIIERQKALIATATETVGRADQLLTPLLTATTGNEALTATLAKQQQALSTYRNQLNTALAQ
jgi:hypothetical protein